MLKLADRNEFQTLLDAVTFNGEDAGRDAIIYLETDRAPIHVSRREFRASVLAHAAALNRVGIDGRDLVVIAHT
ncbi:MAG: hypothetical protein HY870_08655, partial [Chloroflexi bacterium]|nr:hypothetical protein [Chloroflexota bacterium]